eukprot:8029366-Alexandrium_andersonii.AAC.1
MRGADQKVVDVATEAERIMRVPYMAWKEPQRVPLIGGSKGRTLVNSKHEAAGNLAERGAYREAPICGDSFSEQDHWG